MHLVRNILFKYRSKLIIAASTLIILFGIYNIYYILEVRTMSNDECIWMPKEVSKDSIEIYFREVKVDGVTWNAGIRNGDQLLAINNVQATSPTQAQAVLNKLKSDEYANYKIKKDDKIIETKVRIKKLIQIPMLASALLGLIWMIVGFVVLMAKPDGLVQKVFYAIGVLLIFSITNMMLPFNSIVHLSWTYFRILIGYLWALSICFSPFLLVYFFWIFPKQFKFLDKKGVKASLFIIPSILFIITAIQMFLTFKLGYEKFYLFNIWHRLIYFLFGAGNIIGGISLAVNYKRLKSKEEKKSILIILVGYWIGILASFYTLNIAPIITDTFYNSPEYYTPIILIILAPIAFGYSVYRYQLMDVSVVVKNTITYGAATVTVAAIYFFVIFVIGQSISSAIGIENQGIVAGIFFIIFAMIFQSTKDKFQDFLTAKFYPEQFAFQKVLLRFSNEIPTTVGLDNIIEFMSGTFINALKINRFGILLKDENDNKLTLKKAYGLNNEIIKVDDEKLTGIISNKYYVNKNITIDHSDFFEVFPENAVKLFNNDIHTVVPMIIKNKVVGLLLFGLKHSGSAFAGKDLELLCAAANQAAVAVENARLYKSESEKIKIERDLDLARKIQQNLLPTQIPQLTGFDICGQMIPAMQVGGDYFDVIKVSDSKLFVIVGDVSGKGLAASLYMTKLQTMMQLACSEDKTPKEILIEVNKKLYSSFERNWFVTMTVALFDTEKNTVQFCRAGHLPLMVAQNGTVKFYKSQGIGIGLEKGIIFSKTLMEEKLNYTNGQVFAFFSDGITEAMNRNNEMFGEENLTHLIKQRSNKTSKQIIDEVWTSIQSFRGNIEPNDDMTIVLVKISESNT